jgi:TrmH family RNA methyltransferase
VPSLVSGRRRVTTKQKLAFGLRIEFSFRSPGHAFSALWNIRALLWECSARREFAYNEAGLKNTAAVDLENLRVVLVRSRNPLNIGAAARVMSNFGAFHLRVVIPYEKAFREAVSAVSAAPLLAAAEEYGTVEDAVRDCTLVVGTTAIGHRELQHQLYPLDEAAKNIRRKLSSGRVAILFGSEKTGLSNRDLSHCHWLLRIPTREEHRSMNLAQAVGVVIYELSRGTCTVTARNTLTSSAADMQTMNRLSSALLEALHASGYIHRRSAATAEEKLRRMLLRFEFSSADAEVFLGMINKILWKLNS